jgi:hypothetical protein
MMIRLLATPTRLALQTLLVLLTTLTATAQIQNPGGPVFPEPGLEGWSDVLTGDGQEIGTLRGELWEADVLITDNGDGSYHADVYIDLCNGTRPLLIAGESMTIYPVGNGRYVWESAQGGTGILVWNYRLGHYDSLVTGGQHTGAERIIMPHPPTP